MLVIQKAWIEFFRMWYPSMSCKWKLVWIGRCKRLNIFWTKVNVFKVSVITKIVDNKMDFFLHFYSGALHSKENFIKLFFFMYNFRMTISHNPKGPLTKLNLKTVQVTDEDTYLCETTFIEPMESCDNTGSYSIALKVNG